MRRCLIVLPTAAPRDTSSRRSLMPESNTSYRSEPPRCDDYCASIGTGRGVLIGVTCGLALWAVLAGMTLLVAITV
jgi:hypothetical protein